MNHYLNVFWESLWVATIVPFSSEPTFFAMLYFSGYNMSLAAAISVAGATVGMSLNWALGKFLYKLHKQKQRFNISEYWYNKVAVLFNKYGTFLLLLSWAPLLKFVVVIAGFLNMRYRFVLPLVIIGHSVAYGFYLVK